MQPSDRLILLAGLLMLVSVITTRLSRRIGMPILLVFLAVVVGFIVFTVVVPAKVLESETVSKLDRRLQDVIGSAMGGEMVTTTVEGRERYGVRVRFHDLARTAGDDGVSVVVDRQHQSVGGGGVEPEVRAEHVDDVAHQVHGIVPDDRLPRRRGSGVDRGDLIEVGVGGTCHHAHPSSWRRASSIP